MPTSDRAPGVGTGMNKSEALYGTLPLIVCATVPDNKAWKLLYTE